MAFNAKNLSYGMLLVPLSLPTLLTVTTEPKEPAFLRRLRNEHESGESACHERPLPRQRRPQAEGDEEDLPAYMDGDSHNTISKAEYHALFNHAGEIRVETDASATSLSTPHASEMNAVSEAEKPDRLVQVKQAEASIGAGPKRKLAKVIKERHDDGDSSLPFSKIASKKRRKKSQDVKLSFFDS